MADSLNQKAIAPNSITTSAVSNIGQLQAQIITNVAKSGKIFTAFDPNNDVITNQKASIAETMWSNGSGSLVMFYTQSSQATGSTSGRYYLNVFQLPTSSLDSEVQFAVAYGNRFGSGSKDFDSAGATSLTPSRAIYSQYRNILLTPTDETFELANGKVVDQFIVVNFNRARLKDRLDANNWQLWTSGSTGHQNSFVDDSSLTSTPTVSEGGQVYNIVSGSLNANGTITEYVNGGKPRYYGLCYPELGILLFDADMLSKSSSIHFTSGSDVDAKPRNTWKFFNAVSGAAVINPLHGFQARNTQDIVSSYYFVRIKNAEYNFSNNPSFTTGSLGDFKFANMINNPSVYLTTVGLYNDKNELLAVAKTSKPLLKDFSREALLRIKLDF